MGSICREVILLLTLISYGTCSGSNREECGHPSTLTNCKCQVHSDNELSKNVSSRQFEILNSSKVELTSIKYKNGTEIKCFVIWMGQNKTESYLLQLLESHEDIFNTCFNEANSLECHCERLDGPDMSPNVSFLLTGPSDCSQQTKTGFLMEPVSDRGPAIEVQGHTGSLLPDSTLVSTCDRDPPGDPFVTCNNKFVAEGKSLECVCEARFADSRPDDFSLTWPPYSDNSTMKVMKVTREDNSMVFTCLMTWCGHKRTTNYTLHVAYGPDSEHTVIHGPNNSFITDGTLSLTLTCLATEVYPAPRYTWVGVTCQNNDSDQGTCEVKPQPPGYDGRQVECTARSSWGDYNVGRAWYRLSLTYPPPKPPLINIKNQTVGHGDVIHCIVSEGKPLVTSVNFTCLTDPPHHDLPDTRTSSSVFSSLVIDSTKVKENITECVCHAVWTPKEEWYSNSSSVFLFIQAQDKDDLYFQAIIFGASGGCGALVIVLIIIIIVLARSKTRRKDMKDGRHSAWYTYEHTEVRDPQGTNGTDGDYFTHRSARGSVRGWRSFTVSQVNSEAHGPQENGGTFLSISPRTVATTDKTVLQGKGASQSCSNINFSLKPPVSQWQGDENNYTTQEMEYPYEEDEYTYSVLREDEGDTYDNNSFPDDPECLRQEVSHCDIDNSNCLAEDVFLGQVLSTSSEFRDNENNGTGHTSPFLSGTKDTSKFLDTRAELIKVLETRAKNLTGQSKTNVNKGSLENIFIEQSRRKPTPKPRADLLGRRVSRSCSNLCFELQKLTPTLTSTDDNDETWERDMSTDYDDCFFTQMPSESKTNPQDGENKCCYFTLEEDEYSTGYVPSKQGQTTGPLDGQRERKKHMKPHGSATLQPGQDMFAELIKRFEGTASSATNHTSNIKGSLENILREQIRKKPALLPKPVLRGRRSSRSCSNLLLGIQKSKPLMARVEHHHEARKRDMPIGYDEYYCSQTSFHGFLDAGTMSRSTKICQQQEADSDGQYNSFVRDGELQPGEYFYSNYNHINDTDRC